MNVSKIKIEIKTVKLVFKAVRIPLYIILLVYTPCWQTVSQWSQLTTGFLHSVLCTVQTVQPVLYCAAATEHPVLLHHRMAGYYYTASRGGTLQLWWYRVFNKTCAMKT